MAATIRQKHARDINTLHRRVLRLRTEMVDAWRSVEKDSELRRLQKLVDERRFVLEKKAYEQCLNRQKKVLPLEKRLKAAKAAHEHCISAGLSNWLTAMRESSHNRRHWCLIWFTDDERFALVRKPSVKIRITDNTTQGYGVRHALYDLTGKLDPVYEFIGSMSRDNWIVVYKHVIASRKVAASVTTAA